MAKQISSSLPRVATCAVNRIFLVAIMTAKYEAIPGPANLGLRRVRHIPLEHLIACFSAGNPHLAITLLARLCSVKRWVWSTFHI